MPPWPSRTLRIRTPLCFGNRACNIYHFSSSLFPRNRVKPTISHLTNERTSADKNESKAAGLSDSLQSHTVKFNAFKDRMKERASSLSASATLGLAEIGGRLNRITGYEHIEALKRKVVDIEATISKKRQAARDAKVDYEAAVFRRSNSQREVNDLLQRKSSWTESDVGHFTVLVREDHLYEQEESRAKNRVAQAEAEVDVVFNELMRTILNRYHEEQVWSDKIRSASTYGSLLALSVNVVVFFLAIVVVEPWKRRKLAQTFEKRIEEISLENREVLGQGMRDLAVHFEKQEQVFSQVMGLSLREQPDRTDRSETDARAAPLLPVAKTAKAARDREIWIAGAAGVVGGGILPFLIGFFK